MARASLALAIATLVACRAQPTLAAVAQSDELVVRAQGQRVTLRLHQTVRLLRPADFPEWRVDYVGDVLKPLDTGDAMRSPGAAGWRFEAIGSGETDLTVTPVVAGGAPPPRFTVTIRVP
ncbi:MAG TPA: hypothetical protein VFA27_08010 [Vicinamibacterales bacterium]|nr:hypothetical protein [Vicinamibacterales bacterium]